MKPPTERVPESSHAGVRGEKAEKPNVRAQRGGTRARLAGAHICPAHMCDLGKSSLWLVCLMTDSCLSSLFPGLWKGCVCQQAQVGMDTAQMESCC